MSPDATTIAEAFGDLAVIWDANTGDIITSFTHPAPIVTVTYNPDGQHLATTAADGSMELWPIPLPPIADTADAARRNQLGEQEAVRAGRPLLQLGPPHLLNHLISRSSGCGVWRW